MRRVAPHAWDPPRELEPSRLEWPLRLLAAGPAAVGECGDGTCEGPHHLLWDEGRRCFASHWKRLLCPSQTRRSLQALLEHAPWEELTSKKGQVTRETCWYVRGGCKCDYTYGSARVRALRRPTPAFQASMEELLAHLCERLCPWLPREDWPNSANLNLYTRVKQSVGWHADDESLFLGREHDCPIISVSLGSRREFWMALRREGDNSQPKLGSVIEADLEDGDVFTMEGLCQKHCLHFVPCAVGPSDDLSAAAVELKSDGAAAPCDGGGSETSPRINVTWRWVRNHKPKCPRNAANLLYGADRLFCECPGGSGVPQQAPAPCSYDWAGGRPVSWRGCSGCRHDAWKGGRNCLRVGQRWLCRRCWQGQSEGRRCASPSATQEATSWPRPVGSPPAPVPAPTRPLPEELAALPVGAGPRPAARTYYQPAPRAPGASLLALWT